MKILWIFLGGHHKIGLSQTPSMGIDQDSDQIIYLYSCWIRQYERLLEAFAGHFRISANICSKTYLKRSLKNNIKTDYRLMQVKSIAECSNARSNIIFFRVQREHSSILLTFIKLPFSIKTFICFVYF